MNTRLGIYWDEVDARVGKQTLELLAVSQSHGVVPRAQIADSPPRADDFSKYKVCRAGDLVLSRFNAYRGALGVAPTSGMVSPDYLVVRPRAVAHAQYLDYLLRSHYASSEMTKYMGGIGGNDPDASGFSRIDVRALSRMQVPKRSADEQEAIARYLDRETARIDTLVEEQQRLIEILRERKHSLVEEAFGDHRPNSRLSTACVDVVDCPHTTPDVSDDGEYEAVRTASVRDGKYRPGNGLPVDKETWETRNAAGSPAVGDVLFTREAPAGEACMVPNDRICLGQRMVLLRIDRTTCVGEFLLWQVYSDRVQDHFLLTANGSTVANVRLPTLRMTPIWLPSLAEQRRIAAHLDEQASRIDTLINETERFIELSKERRSALITAAVTGQIDVREAA